ncbi:hypothetical protein [Streptomyces sp. NPDC005251]|uniref:hypothetical protein n=1 Tax=unclassified Streptomyces TaxID=2593676 RepID=UPI0033A94311
MSRPGARHVQFCRGARHDPGIGIGIGIGSIVDIALADWSAYGYATGFIRAENAACDVTGGRPAQKIPPVCVGTS